VFELEAELGRGGAASADGIRRCGTLTSSRRCSCHRATGGAAATTEIGLGGSAAVIRTEPARRRSTGGGDGADEVGEVGRSVASGRRPKTTKKMGCAAAAGGGTRRRGGGIKNKTK
jgi:hypothetical protein